MHRVGQDYLITTFEMAKYIEPFITHLDGPGSPTTNSGGTAKYIEL
jgi:hypothetical protein